VFAVVEDKQQSLCGDVLDQPGHGPAARFMAESQRRHDRLGDELGIPKAGELDQPHAIGDRATQVGRGPERQAGLADSTRPDERHHASCSQRRLDILELPAPANEACQLGREVPSWRR
jgi:hypothetical protein